MRRLSPVMVIASGLAMLSCAILLMGDFFFGYLSNRAAEASDVRRRVADIIAVPAIELLSRGELERAGALLERLVAQEADIDSIGVRRGDGHLLLSTTDHQAFWPAGVDAVLEGHHALVPIRTAEKAWGAIEVAYRAPPEGLSGLLTRQPAIAAIGMLLVFGTATFALYMRRVLQQFDPKAVIPDRVRVAFDAMAEGVVITDEHGRIALSNDRFRRVGLDPDADLTGRVLADVPWIDKALGADDPEPPWVRSMREGEEIMGVEITVESIDDQPLLMVINCAPILDGRRRARGCMVTFNDVTALHRANRRLEYTLRQLQDSRREVENKAADLERLANVDYLTGVLNRRAFSAQAEQAFQRCVAANLPFSAMMIDIDHFKKVNDTHGHGVGDMVIKAVAGILMECTRSSDLVGRYGGEEFCVALPETSLTAAAAIGQRIREAIEQRVGPSLAEVADMKVTTSVGVAIRDVANDSLHALINTADAALYAAKESGRNRVRVASSDATAVSAEAG